MTTSNGYTVTADPAAVDLDVVHGALSQSYWAKGTPRETLHKALANSLCFTVAMDAPRSASRMTTDRATFAYLADVFVLPSHRGRGLSKKLMEAIISHPDLQGRR